MVKHVFRPKDLQRDYKKLIENAIRTLAQIRKIIIRSEEKLLNDILGKKAKELLKNIKAKEVNFTNDEQKRISNMSKKSLTFD